MEAEIDNRIAAAWKKFYTFKQELTTKSYSLKGRLRLFHGTVPPTILCGSAAWIMMVELENRLRRTQRQMLRMMLNSTRRQISNATVDERAGQPRTNNDNTNDDSNDNGDDNDGKQNNDSNDGINDTNNSSDSGTDGDH